MTQSGLVIDRDRPESEAVSVAGHRQIAVGERDARAALRAQIGKLERECSAIVANAFPNLSPADVPTTGGEVMSGPCLLTLGELERMRDRLAGCRHDLRRLAQERVEHERRSRELLEGMKLEPGRYKFVRLPVRDLRLGAEGHGVARESLRGAKVANLRGQADGVSKQVLDLLEFFLVVGELGGQHSQRLW